MRFVLPALLALALAQPLLGQGVKERVKDSYRTWNALLERGDAQTVRGITEGLLSREALTVSTADYGEMQAVVALRDVAARACVLDGSWEEGVAHLQKAALAAADNLTVFQGTANRIRKEHDASLVGWRTAMADHEQRLKELEALPGLTEAQMKLRAQLRTSLEEHRAAVAHSEWALKELDLVAAQLQKERDTYAASLASWQAFLDKEKEEREASATPAQFVADKLLQVKMDDARPRFERLSYGRRLLRIDPANEDVKRFVAALMGSAPSDEDEPAPKPAPRKKTRSKR